MNELGSQVLKSVLLEHFKQLMKEFKKVGVSNVVTDYPTMLEFIKKYLHAEKYNNKIYHTLTHKIVPELEKEGVLKRLKLYNGTFVFKINKEKYNK